MARPTRASRLAVLVLIVLSLSPRPLSAQTPGGRSGQPAASTASELVLVKERVTPKQYHRPGCELVRDGKEVLAMSRGDAELRGYTAHRECDPSVAAPGSATGGPGRATAPAPEPTIVIDAVGKFYHRERCPKIGASPRTVALKDAGKRWPCPSCRPPIRKPAEAPLVPRWRG